ncbi:hypothetical protein PIB30_106245, partial [Stylosanthes scabra]|nr:hypothetical protein [Stylosanthes scabra]
FQVTEQVIATIRGDQKIGRECYNASLRTNTPKPKPSSSVNAVYSANTPPLDELDPRSDIQERPSPTNQLEKVQLTNDANRITYIGNAFSADDRTQLINLLR